MQNSIHHYTTCHKYNDHRIFSKHAAFQNSIGKKVKIFAFDRGQKHSFLEENIEIQLLPATRSLNFFSRLGRALLFLKYAFKSKPDIVIFHEPEILIILPLLKLIHRAKYIFDIHEDYPLLIKSRVKNRFLGLIFIKFYLLAENFFSLFLSNKIAATEDILNKYCLKDRDLLVPNLPRFLDSLTHKKFLNLEPFKCAYIGIISDQKGGEILLDFTNNPLFQQGKLELHICGTPRFNNRFSKEDFFSAISKKGVTFYGELGSNELQKVLAETHAGICLIESNPHHNVSFPAKIFDYIGSKNYVLFSDNLKLEMIASLGLGHACDYSLDSLQEKIYKLMSSDFSNFENIDISSYLFSSIEPSYTQFLNS